jgi:hypothetical protein
MYSLVITRVRLDIHLQSPVICREQPESINQKTSMPPTRKIKNESESEQTTQHWVSTKLIKPVSCHLLKSGVRKIHPISPRWNTHMSPWRTTCTMKGRPWPVAPLGPKTAIVPPMLVLATSEGTSSKLTTPGPNTPTTFSLWWLTSRRKLTPLPRVNGAHH